MTPADLARVLRAGLKMTAHNPPFAEAIELMIAECERIETQAVADRIRSAYQDGNGMQHGYTAGPTFTPPPPLPPRAEHQATPDNRFHRVMVWFGGDVAQAKHFETWFNRGDWAAYERWYQSLNPAGAPEQHGEHPAPEPEGNEPAWPEVPPPSRSAPPAYLDVEEPVIPLNTDPLRYTALFDPNRAATVRFSVADTEPLNLAAAGIGTVAFAVAPVLPTAAMRAARAEVYHAFVPRHPEGGWLCFECDGTESADQHQVPQPVTGEPGTPLDPVAD